MAPPREGLHLHQTPRREVVDRLVVELQVVGAQRCAQVRLHRHPLDQVAMEALVEPGDLVAPVVLRPIQGDVGVPQERVDRGSRRRGGEADTGRRPHRASRHDGGPTQCLQESPGDLLGRLRALPVQEEDELVASQAREDVARPDQGLEAAGHLHQELVPGGVAERVVDDLEAVDVHEHRGEHRPRSAEPRLRAPLQLATVQESSEGVVRGLVRQRAPRRLRGRACPICFEASSPFGGQQLLPLGLGDPPLGHVTEVQDDAVRTWFRADLDPHGQRLGVVLLDRLGAPRRHHPVVDPLEPRASAGGEHVPQVPPDEGISRVAHQTLGARVDVGDLVPRVDRDEPVADRLQDRGEACAALVRVGDVEEDADDVRRRPSSSCRTWVALLRT